MTAQRWDGSSQQDISTAKRWDGSSWVDITTAKRWDGSNWQDITFAGGGGGSLAAVATGHALAHFHDDTPPYPSVVTLTTNTVTIVASGGTGPYTYQWTKVSGFGSTCNSPTSLATTWTSNLYQNSSSESIWRCTVTDDIGSTVSVDVIVVLSYTAGVLS